jgi:hypothetical protein
MASAQGSDGGGKEAEGEGDPQSGSAHPGHEMVTAVRNLAGGERQTSLRSHDVEGSPITPAGARSEHPDRAQGAGLEASPSPQGLPSALLHTFAPWKERRCTRGIHTIPT